jgi:hypothetical protein
MSPSSISPVSVTGVSTVLLEQNGIREVPWATYSTLDLLVGPAKEMVVDWQLPSESDRRG